MDHYILDGKRPVKVDMVTWAKWFETANRKVANDVIADFHVSTVFLGMDHSWGNGLPDLFETMVFHPDGDEPNIEGLETKRYTTWQEAEWGHADTLRAIREHLKSQGISAISS